MTFNALSCMNMIPSFLCAFLTHLGVYPFQGAFWLVWDFSIFQIKRFRADLWSLDTCSQFLLIRLLSLLDTQDLQEALNSANCTPFEFCSCILLLNFFFVVLVRSDRRTVASIKLLANLLLFDDLVACAGIVVRLDICAYFNLQSPLVSLDEVTTLLQFFPMALLLLQICKLLLELLQFFAEVVLQTINIVVLGLTLVKFAILFQDFLFVPLLNELQNGINVLLPNTLKCFACFLLWFQLLDFDLTLLDLFVGWALFLLLLSI